MSDKLTKPNMQLSIVTLRPEAPEPEPEHELQDQVKQVVNMRRERIKADVRNWLLYCTSVGAVRVSLDECLNLPQEDHGWVVEWLREEGFEVRAPRFWGRVTIGLAPAT
jgi:hypothetical protein